METRFKSRFKFVFQLGHSLNMHRLVLPPRFPRPLRPPRGNQMEAGDLLFPNYRTRELKQNPTVWSPSIPLGQNTK